MKDIMRVLHGKVIESGVDTFTSEEIETNLEAPEAMLIKAVEFTHNANFNAHGESIHIQLMKDPQTAMGNHINLGDLIVDRKEGLHLLTSGGGIVEHSKIIHIPEPGLVVVRQKIYLEISSANTGVAVEASMRIFYQRIKLSSTEALILSI